MQNKKIFDTKKVIILTIIGSLYIVTFYLGLLYGTSKQVNTTIPVLITQPIDKEDTSNIVFSRSEDLEESPEGWGIYTDQRHGFSVYYPLGWEIDTYSALESGLTFTRIKEIPEEDDDSSCSLDEEVSYSISIVNTKEDNESPAGFSNHFDSDSGGKNISLNGVNGAKVDSYPTAPWLVGPVYNFQYNDTQSITFKFSELCVLKEETLQLQEDFENIFIPSFKSIN